MFRFFRKLRQRLFAGNKFSTYLVTALGEILLVVLGILIALQVDNWNQQRSEMREEQRLLTKLAEDLQNDIAQLEVNIRSARERRAKTDTLLDILADPEQFETARFLEIVYPLFIESHFEVNSGTFDESLASGTIRYIRGDSLRQQTFEYYRDAKLSYADQNTLKMTYEQILPQIVRTVAPSRDFVASFAKKPTLLDPLDLAAIARDRDFFTAVLLKYGLEEDQIRNWEQLRTRASALLRKTESTFKD